MPNDSKMNQPAITPGSPAWQASILPLNHRCLHWITLTQNLNIARAQEGDIASSDPLAELHKGDLISENVLKTNNQLFSIILSSTHRKQLFLYSYSKLTDFRIINDVKKFLHQ